MTPHLAFFLSIAIITQSCEDVYFTRNFNNSINRAFLQAESDSCFEASIVLDSKSFDGTLVSQVTKFLNITGSNREISGITMAFNSFFKVFLSHITFYNVRNINPFVTENVEIVHMENCVFRSNQKGALIMRLCNEVQVTNCSFINTQEEFALMTHCPTMISGSIFMNNEGEPTCLYNGTMSNCFNNFTNSNITRIREPFSFKEMIAISVGPIFAPALIAAMLWSCCKSLQHAGDADRQGKNQCSKCLGAMTLYYIAFWFNILAWIQTCKKHNIFGYCWKVTRPKVLGISFMALLTCVAVDVFVIATAAFIKGERWIEDYRDLMSLVSFGASIGTGLIIKTVCSMALGIFGKEKSFISFIVLLVLFLAIIPPTVVMLVLIREYIGAVMLPVAFSIVLGFITEITIKYSIIRIGMYSPTLRWMLIFITAISSQEYDELKNIIDAAEEKEDPQYQVKMNVQ